VFSLPLLPLGDYSLWLKEPGGKIKDLKCQDKVLEFTRAVILALESILIIGVSITANYWIIGSMKF